MSRLRTFRRNMDAEAVKSAKELEAAVNRSRNAMRKKTGNNAQVRAQNKVLARRGRTN